MTRKRTSEELELSKARQFQRRVEAFWSHVDRRGEDDCWPWRWKKDPLGYGRAGLTVGGQFNRLAHRVAYTLMYGPVPDGLVVDHTCHQPGNCPGGPECPHRACQNPRHLKAVTPKENNARGRVVLTLSTATHCPAGHEYDEKNTRVYQGRRHCRACDRARNNRPERRQQQRRAWRKYDQKRRSK